MKNSESQKGLNKNSCVKPSSPHPSSAYMGIIWSSALKTVFFFFPSWDAPGQKALNMDFHS